MRRFFLLLTMSLALLGVYAANITSEQALTVAQRFAHDNQKHFASGYAVTDLKLAHVALSNGIDADYFVFNLAADGGYIIVGGNDVTMPVWGYSTYGSFEFDKLPENMRWWLSEYQRQLDWLRENPDAGTLETTTLKSSVAPLLSSTWDQNTPYNNLCPLILSSGTYYRAPTGCLATAMAQIMYHYRWPLKGDGSHTYTFTPYGGSAMTLTADFSQSTYEWNNMLNSYAGSYTNAQANAVAKLMSDAGISIDMSYNTNESSAYYKNAIEALMAYFDYSPAMSFQLKDNYSGDWDALMRSELDAARPIFYFGQNPDNAGHAFVLDGYDNDGYFHVNWGWGGDYDGYFLTSLMRPYSPSSYPDRYNYSYSQGAVIGIQPDNTGTGAIVLKSGINPLASTMPANDVSASFDIEALGGPYNGTLKLVVCTKTGNSSYSWYSSNVSSLNISLEAGERKTIRMNRSFNVDEGSTYYFFLIDPYVTIANYSWCDPVPFTVGDWPFIFGDVNGSGSLTIADATVLIDYLLNDDSTGINLTAADVNRDGTVSISDVTTLIDILLNVN